MDSSIPACLSTLRLSCPFRCIDRVLANFYSWWSEFCTLYAELSSTGSNWSWATFSAGAIVFVHMLHMGYSPAPRAYQAQRSLTQNPPDESQSGHSQGRGLNTALIWHGHSCDQVWANHVCPSQQLIVYNAVWRCDSVVLSFLPSAEELLRPSHSLPADCQASISSWVYNEFYDGIFRQPRAKCEMNMIASCSHCN